MNNYPSYTALKEHFQHISSYTLNDLFKSDPNRGDEFILSLDNLSIDFSKNNITEDTLNLLIKLAQDTNLSQKIKHMFLGVKINQTEDRAVSHTTLRAQNKDKDTLDMFLHMKLFVENIHNLIHVGFTSKPITDIVNIGIGGSDLGPVLACNALTPYKTSNLNVHFISTIDPYQICTTLEALNPETTLFIISSKTFTTVETMTNAHTAREWFLSYAKDTKYICHHFVACSTNITETTKFGIDIKNVFAFPDTIGGRYSLFSSIGLSIMLYIGYDNFMQMLNGAHTMDVHFENVTDYRKNIPVILGLISIWYTNFYHYHTHIISPYNIKLKHLPAYIQQLMMESNGKSVDIEGNRISYDTCPIIWGDHGINGQHAYYQLLHQGTSINPMDIIIALKDTVHPSNKLTTIQNHNDILVANAFAQAEALMNGKTMLEIQNELIQQGLSLEKATYFAKHKTFEGNRPSTMISFLELTPYNLGMLIALYEHKTFVMGAIWNINSFDQMGVELGKKLANTIYKDIVTKNVSTHDSSTTNLIRKYLDSIHHS